MLEEADIESTQQTLIFNFQKIFQLNLFIIYIYKYEIQWKDLNLFHEFLRFKRIF